jgi:hypothetical protein
MNSPLELERTNLEESIINETAKRQILFQATPKQSNATPYISPISARYERNSPGNKNTMKTTVISADTPQEKQRKICKRERRKSGNTREGQIKEEEGQGNKERKGSKGNSLQAIPPIAPRMVSELK